MGQFHPFLRVTFNDNSFAPWDVYRCLALTTCFIYPLVIKCGNGKYPIRIFKTWVSLGTYFLNVFFFSVSISMFDYRREYYTHTHIYIYIYIFTHIFLISRWGWERPFDTSPAQPSRIYRILPSGGPFLHPKDGVTGTPSTFADWKIFRTPEAT